MPRNILFYLGRLPLPLNIILHLFLFFRITNERLQSYLYKTQVLFQLQNIAD